MEKYFQPVEKKTKKKKKNESSVLEEEDIEEVDEIDYWSSNLIH